MSWDSYIDNLVAQSNNAAEKACIIGLDGGAPWTTTAHAKSLKLSPTEAANIASCFKAKDFTMFQSAGVYAEGTKFQFLRVEENKVVYAKKKEHGGLSLQASKTAIVIAKYGEGSQAGDLNKAVGVIAEYLESMNM